MVVFFDLETDDDDPLHEPSSPHHLPAQSQRYKQRQHAVRFSGLNLEQDNVNVTECEAIQPFDHDGDLNGKLFASALACYPVSLSITGHLDLNDLYSLSMTCRKVHDSLSQFAYQLRKRSLRCTNDMPPKTSEEEVDAVIFQEAMQETVESSLSYVNDPALSTPFITDGRQPRITSNSSLGLSGKVSQCARDMVAPCRKCGAIVCRNCRTKPPTNRSLPNRFRRLCKTCLEAPVTNHLRPLKVDSDLHDTPPASSASSARSVVSLSPSSSCNLNDHSISADHAPSFTSPTFLRTPCSCVTYGVYLCQPCGLNLHASDTTYKRVWTWRSRYSTHIGGGLGTGLGLGDQGQKCGRGEYCLERGAAGVCWVEIECSETRPQNQGRGNEGFGFSRSSTPLMSESESEGAVSNKPGYLRQEMEGIGGVVKKKVKKRVKVGATVYEFDDERETGKYLHRESSGKQRSWCGWCSRVCPGERDQQEIKRLLTSQV